MRLRKVEHKPPESTVPFPVALFIVGVGVDGTEVFRHDMELALKAYGEELTFTDSTFKLEWTVH